jgi:predicted RNA-binding Zn ribbon-like protein
MAAPPSSPTEFRFGLGHLSLEFLATLAGRFRKPFDRLVTPPDLEQWLVESGLLEEVRCDKTDLARARELREAIYRVVEAARHGRHPTDGDIALINRWARKTTPAPQLGPHLDLTWSADGPASAALAHIARSAVELLSGPDLGRVRNCADTTCSLLFIDRSRPGRRRWCSMDRCGNKSKTARYRHRRREPSTR